MPDLCLPSQPPSVFQSLTAEQGVCFFLPPLADPAESIPAILDGFHSREVRAGQLVELPCIASGYPNPAIRWVKDGRPLPADSRWTKRLTGLTISDLRVEDSGTYICEVTNTFGSAEVTGMLAVIGKGQETPWVPQESLWRPAKVGLACGVGVAASRREGSGGVSEGAPFLDRSWNVEVAATGQWGFLYSFYRLYSTFSLRLKAD